MINEDSFLDVQIYKIKGYKRISLKNILNTRKPQSNSYQRYNICNSRYKSIKNSIIN
jgi:hypothetical protein